jgi:hypothetical protein
MNIAIASDDGVTIASHFGKDLIITLCSGRRKKRRIKCRRTTIDVKAVATDSKSFKV